MKRQTAKKKRLKDERGFTLVEILIVVVLSSMLFYGIAAVMRSGSGHAQTIGTKTTLQTSSRSGLIHMLEEIRETAPTRIFIGVNSLTFQIPTAVSNAGIITWSPNLQYSLGGLNNTQLLRTDTNGNTTVVANDVQSMTFTPNDPANPTRLLVTLNLQRQTVQGRQFTETLSGEAMIRNE